MFTMHGVVMVFFFLIPSIPAVLGNFLLPIMVGRQGPGLSAHQPAQLVHLRARRPVHAVAALSGGVDTGWTFYTPYSTAAANSHVMTAALGVFITGFSSILTGLNFIVTVHRMRAPGMTWFRLPLFVWAHYATSLIMILGTPVIAITVLMVAAERALHLGIFDPALGGDPVLFQHLFWFYSHPAVYIMILPAMGVISEIVQAFSRKNIFGYSFIAFSSLAIAIIGFLVWGHHLFVAGQSTYAGLVFSIPGFLVAIPSAIKVFNWTATIYRGSVQPRIADALRVRVHRPVHDRRPHGSVPGGDGPRHPRARHLLRRRALPLHHGRRRHHGLPRRPALLVAEDHRQALFRAVGEVLRADGVRRLQPDVLPAVPRRLPRACRGATTRTRRSSRC